MIKNIGQMIVTPKQYQEGWFEFKYKPESNAAPKLIRHSYVGGSLLKDGNYIVPVMTICDEEK